MEHSVQTIALHYYSLLTLEYSTSIINMCIIDEYKFWVLTKSYQESQNDNKILYTMNDLLQNYPKCAQGPSTFSVTHIHLQITRKRKLEQYSSVF